MGAPPGFVGPEPVEPSDQRLQPQQQRVDRTLRQRSPLMLTDTHCIAIRGDWGHLVRG